jgi:hypothetical protein
MTYYIIKLFISAAVIVAVSETAKRSGYWGGVIASLPLLSILAITWLYLDTHDSIKVAALARSTVWFVLPALPFFSDFARSAPNGPSVLDRHGHRADRDCRLLHDSRSDSQQIWSPSMKRSFFILFTFTIGLCAAEPLKDLSLEKAIEIALKNHPSLAEAEAHIEIAKARAEAAGKLPNPDAVARMGPCAPQFASQRRFEMNEAESFVL